MNNNILNYRHETDNYKHLLELCKKTYNNCGFIYIVAYGVVAAASLFYGILKMLSGDWHGFDVILDGTIFKGVAFVPAYLSIYKKENKYIIFSLLVLFINAFTMIAISDSRSCSVGVVNTIFIGMNIDISIKTVIANNSYHFLEKQFGFPYFNEMKDERKFDEIGRNIKDDFKIASEERLKTACDSMEGLDFTGERISAKINEKNNYMNDVSLVGETSSDLIIKTNEDD